MQRLRNFFGRNIWNKIFVIILIIIVLGFLTSIIGDYAHNWYFSWAGVSDYKKPPNIDARGKTLWDWLDLLIVPVVLAIGAFFLNRSERTSQNAIEERRQQIAHELEEKRSKNERGISIDLTRETSLQTYLDKMTELLVKEGLRNSKSNDVIRNIARARTLTILRKLDGERKGLIIRFLYEADLIKSSIGFQPDELRDGKIDEDELKAGRKKPILILENSDLSEAVLSDISLNEIHLNGVNLNQAFIENSYLASAIISRSKLEGVKLKNSNLGLAQLSDSNLTKAELYNSYLTDADLNGVTLSNAILDNVNLRLAKLNKARLLNTKLTDTILDQADLLEADLSGAEFKNVSMVETNFRKTIMVKTNLIGANLKDVYFTEANLEGINFEQAKLEGCRFFRANLKGAILRGASLQDTDFYEANLEGADLSGCIISQTSFSETKYNKKTVWPHNFSPDK